MKGFKKNFKDFSRKFKENKCLMAYKKFAFHFTLNDQIGYEIITN